jgi:hypothetical protein
MRLNKYKRNQKQRDGPRLQESERLLSETVINNTMKGITKGEKNANN